jgi:hypothetical protein
MTKQSVMIAAVFACLVLAVPAFAQSGTGTSGQTGVPGTPGTTGSAGDPGTTGATGTGQTGQPEPGVGTTGQTGSSDLTARDEEPDYNHEWVVTGFVGGNFGQNSLSSSVDFGGTISYLYKGFVGGEFIAGFSPKFKFDRLVTGDADINNYMANAIVAIPVGSLHGFRPFVSGGLGAVTMSLNSNAIFPLGPSSSFINTAGNNSVFDPNASHFAGDIGVGVMAFGGRWGVRGDVRYFSSIGTTNSTGLLSTATGSTTTLKDNSLLNDVKFWRANIGVAFRF